MCGEKGTHLNEHGRQAGSPPRVRGKGMRIRDYDPDFGITPACAGKRSTRPPAQCRRWDHPRVCGEKGNIIEAEKPIEGSPPRVRGKDGIISIKPCSLGITPACAGKSYPVKRQSCRTEDHPRVCGEKDLMYSTISFTSGSPPRVRGKVLFMFFSFLPVWITPACAGKSFILDYFISQLGDHPRVCGEK